MIFNLAFAVLALVFIFKGGVLNKESSGLEYKDFISILLTGLSAMMAIGAIFIAVLAIWSYSHFKQLTIEAAASKADEVVKDWLSDKAPGVVRTHVDLLRDATLGDGDDDVAADKIGKGAG